jgi:hypothetical protein
VPRHPDTGQSVLEQDADGDAIPSQSEVSPRSRPPTQPGRSPTRSMSGLPRPPQACAGQSRLTAPEPSPTLAVDAYGWTLTPSGRRWMNASMKKRSSATASMMAQSATARGACVGALLALCRQFAEFLGTRSGPRQLIGKRDTGGRRECTIMCRSGGFRCGPARGGGPGGGQPGRSAPARQPRRSPDAPETGLPPTLSLAFTRCPPTGGAVV